MGTNTGEKPAASLFARVIGRLQSPWVIAGIGLLLVLAPILAAYLDGLLVDSFRRDYWRLLLQPAAVITYILAVSLIIGREEGRVVEAFRPLVLIDDEGFDRLVEHASRINPIGEVAAFGVGASFGLWLGNSWFADGDAFWLRLYLPLSLGFMFGLLLWTIYVAMAGTRLSAELHRQPLRIDIFDMTPFEPIGRQSLVIALVFVGGIVLGMLFSLRQETVYDWRNWVVYFLLAPVPIVLFFLNMRGTHRVLAAEKKRELAAVQQDILQACRALMERMEASEDTGTLGAEINALATYEERLQGASTWPYDTGQLRTLFVSVIIPGGAALVRAVSEMMLE